MVTARVCGLEPVAGFARKFAPAPESATTANGLAPTGAGAPAAVAGLSGGGIAAVAPLPGVAAPPAVSGAVAGAVLAAAEGVPPAVAAAIPIVVVAVPEPEVIAVAAVGAEDRLVVPEAMVAESPVAERSLEAPDPKAADRAGPATAVAGLMDVAGAAIEFAMACTGWLMGW